MGNYIASSMAEKQKEIQKGMLEEMLKNQIKGGERQRKMMLSMQQAFVRESLNWSLPTYAFCLTSVITLIARKQIPRPVIGPFIPIGVFLAYQYDFAYGNKLARVNTTFEEILAEKYGITLPKEESSNEPQAK